MTGEEFVANEWVLKLIADLKGNNIKLEGEFDGDDIRQLNSFLKSLKMICSEDENFIPDMLAKDYDDIYKFTFSRTNDGSPRGYGVVPIDIITFAAIRYFPDNFEKYLSMSYKTAKKIAKILVGQYKAVFGK